MSTYIFLYCLYLLSDSTVFFDKKDLYNKFFFLQALISAFMFFFIFIILDLYGSVCLMN